MVSRLVSGQFDIGGTFSEPFEQTVSFGLACTARAPYRCVACLVCVCILCAGLCNSVRLL